MGGKFEFRSFQVSSNHINPDDGFGFNLESVNSASLTTNLQPFRSSTRSFELSSYGDSAYNSETSNFSQAVLKYISDMLMEEDLEDKPCMLQDCLALQAAEKSLYDVLGEKYPPICDQSPSSIDQNNENPDDYFATASDVGSCNSYPSADNLAELNWNFDQGKFESANILNRVTGNVNKLPDSAPQKSGRSFLSNLSRGRKNQQHENGSYLEEEGRSKKHSAVIYTGVSDQLEIFDNSFLHKVENNESLPCPLFDASRNEESKKLQQNEQSPNNTRMRRHAKDKKMFDLSTLLIQCAQATGTGDQRTAYQQLKLIRLHASPYGDANQRLAHYFANALEARLAGSGKLMPTLFIGPSTNTADILKAYQLYVSVCPFRKMSNFFTNRTITKAVEKATRLHIIDFGISYGFQWPCFIYHLSTRPGGPPKVRITGIDYPQPGFRPGERVEETGRRLKRLADKLNVPFEYNAIAQKWETIQGEDLQIDKDEVVAVCCMNRLKNLPDDTIVLDSPRDAVLRLIKSINPVIFLHGVVNGSYNAPFFATRFREALFHFSSLFDMFEAIATREDQERLVFERELIGKDVMNVVACEGSERFERPETYKQWQIRNSRIGFRQLPLHQDIVKRVRNIKNDYHKDFAVDEDGHWMLMGWKGRIIHAISAWKPIEE
ncbi:Chitin-inducible gibberellin-responsive protein, putative [Ricinus communis]|uniref:Chitin-inducible gibberellin-responsive protein, putative n=1 Tax=Ricinus communis TaxID=3988 RepID=B9T682_RICCO|nr:Chitin-inducible gibberellin-responsive protein, putative [Ricinus communis]|eukprot:XP_002533751.1 scarecrow-like protein 14 [Ricinus communis]